MRCFCIAGRAARGASVKAADALQNDIHCDIREKRSIEVPSYRLQFFRNHRKTVVTGHDLTELDVMRRLCGGATLPRHTADGRDQLLDFVLLIQHIT